MTLALAGSAASQVETALIEALQDLRGRDDLGEDHEDDLGAFEEVAPRADEPARDPNVEARTLLEDVAIMKPCT